MNAALRLIATGGALPGRTVTNEDLSRMVDTSDEWITTRTGIRARQTSAAASVPPFRHRMRPPALPARSRQR